MTQLLFRNFQLLEPEVGELRGGFELLVEGETVREVSDKPIKAPGADVVDCGGRTLMPGLIDSHVHVTLSEVNFRYLEGVPQEQSRWRGECFVFDERVALGHGLREHKTADGSDE